MKITFLGTGTSQGIPVIACTCEVCQSSDKKDKRSRVSILISTEQKNLVIDTGPDFRTQMLENQVNRLDAVYFTHEHRDHTAGLDDIRPFNFKQKSDMPIYASKQVQVSLRKSFDYIFVNPYPGIPKIIFHDVTKDKSFWIGDIHIQPIEYFHAHLPVLGFRVKNFAYLTDFKEISADQEKYLKDLDVLVLSVVQFTPHYSHLHLSEALDYINKWKPKITYLTHLSHNLGRHEALEFDLPAHVKLAFDGMTLEI
jgi:phosphoribosyl 1,2-cyclic phosphate phosphodiesterase